MKLVVIEGIGKKDTIKKYLGKDYEVVATKGHIRDLPVKTLGVDIKDNFKPQYEIIADKQDIVKSLKDKAKKAEKVYLATDPDREGEAISWHLSHILNLNANDNVRIEFNEISKNAVNKGLKNPRPINLNLVDAQQARRVLDRIVGYKLSPVICRKIQPKLSAGRVQSVALKLVVDREKEILNFKPEEYWTLLAHLNKIKDSQVFKSSLAKIKGKKAEIKNKEEMEKTIENLKNGEYIVKSVKKSIGKSKPSAPYTTSTMQAAASSKLGFSVKKASMCAQSLYEGVDLGSEGKVALVTYIRTDSVRVSPEAQAAAKEFITKNFGAAYAPKSYNIYKTKSSAQDAHEAIRPISLERTPAAVKEFLSNDNYKLYKLIYERYLASQMAEGTYNSVSIEIVNGNYLFKTNGKTPIFDGYQRAFDVKKEKLEAKKLKTNEDEELNEELPILVEGEKLELKTLVPTQKFTKAPSRFTEATLVEEMENKGIGRPATYAPTISTLTGRKYLDFEEKHLKPSELGFKVTEFLEKHFVDVMDVKYTANMEAMLDEIAEHGTAWQNTIQKFYDNLYKELLVADKDTEKFKIEPKKTDIMCDKCGSPMVIRMGRFGEFLACSAYPDCKNIQKQQKIVAKCPVCGKNVVERTSKKKKIFYGCSDWPNCNFVSWDMPIDEKCPTCGEYLTKKEDKTQIKIRCSNVNCKFINITKKENNEKAE